MLVLIPMVRGLLSPRGSQITTTTVAGTGYAMIMTWERCLLVWSSSKLGLSFNFFQFIVYSCIFYSLINISNRLIPRGNVFLIMLLFSVGIVDSLNLFRTYIALYLAAWSLVYLTDNKVIFAAFVCSPACEIIFVLLTQ